MTATTNTLARICGYLITPAAAGDRPGPDYTRSVSVSVHDGEATAGALEAFAARHSRNGVTVAVTDDPAQDMRFAVAITGPSRRLTPAFRALARIGE